MLVTKCGIHNYVLKESVMRGSPGLAHLSTITNEAAPPFAVFEGWAPRTSTPCSFVTYNQTDSVLPIPNAQPAPSLLRRWIFALYHYQLLSAPRHARQPAESKPVSPGVVASATALCW